MSNLLNETFQKHLGLLKNRLNELDEPNLPPVIGRKKTWDDNRESLINSLQTNLDILRNQHNTDSERERVINDLLEKFVTFCVIHEEKPRMQSIGYYLVVDDIIKDINNIMSVKKITSPPTQEQLKDVIDQIFQKYKYIDVKNPAVLKDIDIKDDGHGGIISANYKNHVNYQILKLTIYPMMPKKLLTA